MMEFGGIAGMAYTFCTWFVRMFVLNILWLLFSLAGLIVFGIVPSTVALFTIIRKWLLGEQSVPIFKTYWKTYKSEFLKANKLGVLLILIGGTLLFNLYYLSNIDYGILSQIMYFGMFSILIIFLVTLLYVFPVFVHYETKVLQVIKNAFVIGVSNPVLTISMIISSILIYILLELTGFLFFFQVSLIASLIMWLANQSFVKIDSQRETNQPNQEVIESTST
ncbi:YesL family protein [Evansella tamaricis]|uniref:YesL family protein n=1 Tax=Evansella tamaricis TaxID=2069301 RepID=A0ABS6JCK1_9BACI|nr:YesL family protein [Evansella tamaricis]MBU9710572.1 YesL family protein [Evansella tamaricis]